MTDQTETLQADLQSDIETLRRAIVPYHSMTLVANDVLLRILDALEHPVVRTALTTPPTATCVCGANPPRRPWTPDAGDDPCRDGNGNFRPGHRYTAPAAPPTKCDSVHTYFGSLRICQTWGPSCPDRTPGPPTFF